MPSIDCCANTCEPKMVTLTDTLIQTEKQIYGIQELANAIDYKLNGPVLKAEKECSRSDCQGIQDQANLNLAMLNDIAVQLSRIVERL